MTQRWVTATEVYGGDNERAKRRKRGEMMTWLFCLVNDGRNGKTRKQTRDDAQAKIYGNSALNYESENSFSSIKFSSGSSLLTYCTKIFWCPQDSSMIVRTIAYLHFLLRRPVFLVSAPLHQAANLRDWRIVCTLPPHSCRFLNKPIWIKITCIGKDWRDISVECSTKLTPVSLRLGVSILFERPGYKIGAPLAVCTAARSRRIQGCCWWCCLLSRVRNTDNGPSSWDF